MVAIGHEHEAGIGGGIDPKAASGPAGVAEGSGAEVGAFGVGEGGAGVEAEGAADAAGQGGEDGGEGADGGWFHEHLAGGGLAAV